MRLLVIILAAGLFCGCELLSSDAEAIPDTPLVDTTWEFIRIETPGRTIEDSDLLHTITLFLSSEKACSPDEFNCRPVEGNAFAGEAPCNSYSGAYMAEGDSFRVNKLLKSLALCGEEPDDEARELYFQSLLKSETYEIDQDQLQIIFDQGRIFFQVHDDL